ncbi:dioxygenase family protein [Parasphingorhabdus pacifica]
MNHAGPERMPAVYLSHGAPPLADDPVWTRELAEWSGDLPEPHAVLMISAHWEQAPLAIGATTTVPLIYDFWGFPERYYAVRYPAPGSPELAARVRALLRGRELPVENHPARGLDHGAYVPLKEMYPDAHIPVLQISMPTLQPEDLLRVGRALAPLRDEGVLIVGSGFFTHNLRALQAPSTPNWSVEFDDWGRHALGACDVDSLLDFRHKAPASDLAHPRTEHFAPLFVTLGAAEDELSNQRTAIDGFWHGLSKRSVQFGSKPE